MSLLVVAGVLIGSVVLSLMFPKKLQEHDEVSHDPLDPADDPGAPDPAAGMSPCARSGREGEGVNG